ncbi:PBP1A family penicillin-binding protein [Paenibacillus barcinonensis]|uniref:1A family penicillin-binding protein n=1 Tax=Paenibacillus barcinonensis TaxID=198119 RepID=A0A2V4URM9_PAEBA|nr:PBP1A family penicillin-binding protein [Paenibacillus barcinonensis]PYE42743.1 1A family penicillin-binding protein [Paenibacillus barcinonensis]QKS57939.1 PBP1A family penicillin-binding protein [Paenibacillus barcinonensis]
MNKPSAKTRKRGFRVRSFIKNISILTALGLIAGVAILVYLYATSLPLAESDRNSRLLDSKGEVIATFSAGGKDSIPVQLQDISPDLVNATLAVEDRKFRDHLGFDIQGMGRAILVNIQHMRMSQGASTLTQQLARNLYLSHEKTWTRKAKEAMYTAQLEMKYSKDEILQMYLNEIYYGHGAYGIEAAAQMYFGKSAKQLDLAESAMLAGIPKGPTYYSPYNHMKNAKDRQRIVLKSMMETGNITEQQADSAYEEMLYFKPESERNTVESAPYFRDYIRNLAVKELGISEAMLDHGGLNIYTTLDLRVQKAAEEAVAKGLDAKSELETALVSIDPRTGYIKAMVGGKNYRTNQINHVLATTRQPGSAFKPIMYLAALESKQLTSASIFNSQPTSFHYDNDRKTYKPGNFGDKYLGEIDLRQAIAASDNIYAVNTIMKVGAEKVVSMAQNLGITSKLSPVPSLALGTSPVSPLEMASAFSVIAAGGQRTPPIAILQVTDAAGRVIYESPQTKAEAVVEPAAAYVLTRLMESVFENGGTGNRVSATIKRPVAGKTGTTNTDAWMVGFTPELSTAVWVGYDQGKSISTSDGRRAAPIFAQFTEQALASVPPKIFSVPDQVVNVYINPETGKLAGNGCEEKRLEVFIKGTEPTEVCRGETEPTDSPQDEKAREIQNQKGIQEQKHSWWSDFKRWWVE